jgi:hypothetical protein
VTGRPGKSRYVCGASQLPNITIPITTPSSNLLAAFRNYAD